MRAPSILEATWIGGLLGLGFGLSLTVVERLAAAAGDMLWTVQRPWLGALGLSVVFGAAFGVAGSLLETLRRIPPLCRLNGWALVASVLGCSGIAARTLAQVSKRWITAGLVPEWHQIVLLGTYLVVFGFALTRLHRARLAGVRSTVGAGGVLLIASVPLGFFFNLYSEELKADRFGLLRLLTALVAIGLAGLVQPGLSSPRPSRRRLGRALGGGMLLVGLVLALLQGRTEGRSASAGKVGSGPNVLLVVLDTLRRDAVSAYGIVDGITPHLDAFAKQGVLWTDAIAPGNWTVPSHASLFTGAQVSRHGSGYGQRTLPSEFPTLAQRFRDAGWSTAAFVANANLNRRTGFARGFDRYHESWRVRLGLYDLFGQLFGSRLGWTVADKGGAEIVRAVARWWQGRDEDDRPYFVFINFLEPHAPYVPPPAWRGRFSDPASSWRAARLSNAQVIERRKFGGATEADADALWGLYLDAVAYQDHLVGLLLGALERWGHSEETIVILTSDHGENFGWMGQLGHGGALNEGLVQIPLLGRGPSIPEGMVESFPVSLVDLPPTLLWLVGESWTSSDPGRPGRVMPPLVPNAGDGERIRIAERLAFRGPDSMPEAGSDTIRAGVDLRWFGEQASIYRGDFLAMAPAGLLFRRGSTPQPPGRDGAVEIDDPELLESLLVELELVRGQWHRGPGAPPPGEQEMDPEVRRQLEALGYLQGTPDSP